jgi:hypothetical protein
VDAAAHYRQLLQLGRDEFLASAAPAALVRYRTAAEDPAASGIGTMSLDEEIEETLPHSRVTIEEVALEVFPLVKKPGAAFADRITIGRTSNNDIVINDTSVSRLHAYVRHAGGAWMIADAGSKNGSSLLGIAMQPRREQPLPSRAQLELGDVDLTFYLAADLYAALGGPA